MSEYKSPDHNDQPEQHQRDFVLFDESISSLLEHVRAAAGTLRNEAFTDELTGLPNRRAFMRASAEELSGSPERHFAFGLIDLGNFKNVNDMWGHAQGDATLIKVATQLRRPEIAGILSAGRVGGDELAVLLDLDDVRNPENTALTYAQRLSLAQERFHRVGDEMRASDPKLEQAQFYIGFGAYLPSAQERTDARSIREVISKSMEHADEELYEDKATERTRLGFDQINNR